MRGYRLTGSLILLLIAITVLLVAPSVSYAQGGDKSGIDWLRNNRVAVRPEETIVDGTIFTIVPASKRMIVKSGNPEKTLVLGLVDDVEVGDGKAKLSVDDLQRGNDIVVILRQGGLARAIYRK